MMIISTTWQAMAEPRLCPQTSSLQEELTWQQGQAIRAKLLHSKHFHNRYRYKFCPISHLLHISTFPSINNPIPSQPHILPSPYINNPISYKPHIPPPPHPTSPTSHLSTDPVHSSTAVLHDTGLTQDSRRGVTEAPAATVRTTIMSYELRTSIVVSFVSVLWSARSRNL